MNDCSALKDSTLNESDKRRKNYKWPERWAVPGGRTLVFAVAVRAVLDREDIGNFWLEWLKDEFGDAGQHLWEHGGLERFGAKKLG